MRRIHWLLPVLLAWPALAQKDPTPSAAGSSTPPADPAAALQESIAKQRAAMDIQREAAHKQADLLRLPPLAHTLSPSAETPVQWECDPIPDDSVNPIIEGAAKANSIQPDLVRAIIRQESQFHPCAVSDKGAQGLMQLMPATSHEFAVSNAFDPKQSIEAGVKYLKQLFDKYKGNLELVLGAYNAGPAAVDEVKGVPDIPETKDYVQAILESLVKKP
ncbi:MAG TPA: lytic transglycosylase domain-containing protein [Bryobacteraceae bacterium]